MNVAKLLERRQNDWTELERLCESMEIRGRTDAVSAGHRGAAGIARFSFLYRAACADLALADAYQLPPGTVTYLHRLVARAHNQLYRTQTSSPSGLFKLLFQEAPQQIFNDGCVRIATVMFFGLFALAMAIGSAEEQFPGFAEAICGPQMLQTTSDSFEKPMAVNPDEYTARAAFYIRHNTGIGLQCFACGILIIPCLFTLAYNAIVLGTTFGYMSRESTVGSENFFEFVTAHGPFELSAIALAAGAGLRLGVGFVYTRGLTRVDSAREAGRQAVPVMAASVMLFVLAAFTEGFLSPSGAPYLFKVAWSIFSSGLITLYFVVLGFPRQDDVAGGLVRSARYDDLFAGETSESISDSGGSSYAT